MRLAVGLCEAFRSPVSQPERAIFILGLSRSDRIGIVVLLANTVYRRLAWSHPKGDVHQTDDVERRTGEAGLAPRAHQKRASEASAEGFFSRSCSALAQIQDSDRSLGGSDRRVALTSNQPWGFVHPGRTGCWAARLGNRGRHRQHRRWRPGDEHHACGRRP